MTRREFMDEMTWWEIKSYLQGMRRRERAGWQMMRMHAWMILSALGGKAERPEDLIQYWWETEPEEKQEDDPEDLARLRRWAEEWNKTH